jgi:hypothetical protein
MSEILNFLYSHGSSHRESERSIQVGLIVLHIVAVLRSLLLKELHATPCMQFSRLEMAWLPFSIGARKLRYVMDLSIITVRIKVYFAIYGSLFS